MDGWLVRVVVQTSAIVLVTMATNDLGLHDSPPIIYPGEIMIGLLVDLHHPSPNGTACSVLNAPAVQQIMAAQWAIEVLNNQSEPNATKLGLIAYDTCGSPEVAARHIFHLLTDSLGYKAENCTENPKTRPLLLGLIGLSESNIVASVVTTLAAFQMPFILASSGGIEAAIGQKNVLVTAPYINTQVKPIVSVLKVLRWRNVRVLASSGVALQEFRSMASSAGIQISHTVLMVQEYLDNESLDKLLEKPKERPVAIVALLTTEELRYVASLLAARPHRPDRHIEWILASPVLDKASLPELGRALGTGVFVEPHAPELAGFKEHFLFKMKKADVDIDFLLAEYAEKEYGCKWYKLPLRPEPLCSELNNTQLMSGFHQDPGVVHVTEAVSAFAAALRILTLDRCHQVTRCEHVRPVGPGVLRALRKLGYTFRKDLPPELEGARHRFTDTGRLVTVHSHVIYFNQSSGPTMIGWYSEELGLTLETIPKSLARAQLETSEYQNMWAERLATNTTQTHRIMHELLPSETTYDIRVEHVSHSVSVKRAWATTVLVLSSLGVLVTIYILVYVLVRMCDGTLIGNQFLGIALLVSVAALYATCVLFVLPPSEMLCGWRLVAHSCSHALCYGVLLVKVMALRSLVLLGLGGTMSHANQAVTLLFIVGVQLAVVVQWWVLSRPLASLASVSFPSGAGILQCSALHKHFVVLHVPAMVTLGVTCLYALATHRIRRNHYEGRWVLLAVVMCLPVWVGWGIVYSAASPELQDPAVCAQLLTIATIVVLGVFTPKLRTISRQAAAFRHKKLPSSHSVTTVFSIGNDLDTLSAKSRRSVPSAADGILRNPLYEAYNRKLVTIPEKIEK